MAAASSFVSSVGGTSKLTGGSVLSMYVRGRATSDTLPSRRVSCPSVASRATFHAQDDTLSLIPRIPVLRLPGKNAFRIALVQHIEGATCNASRLAVGARPARAGDRQRHRLGDARIVAPRVGPGDDATQQIRRSAAGRRDLAAFVVVCS